MTQMIQTPPEALVTGTVTVAVSEIDESFFSHLSQSYWAWRELFDRDPSARITQHPDYVLNELQFARDIARGTPVLCVAYCQSQPVGAAVLVPKSLSPLRCGPVQWKLHGLRLAGSRLLGRQDAEVQIPILLAVRDHVRQNGTQFVLLENIEDWDILLRRLQKLDFGLRCFKPAPSQAAHKIELPRSFDEYLQKFSSKTRNTLKRKQKQFGACRLQRVTDIADVPDFLSNAHEISQHSWQTSLLGLRIRNDIYEQHVFACLAQEEALRSYVLWKDDVPVSFCVGTQCKDLFSYEEVAYDRRWSELSPGQVLVVKMIEDLISHDRPAVFDFGFGDADYKRQFANLTTNSADVWLLPTGTRSACLTTAMSARQLALKGARQVLAKTGALRKIKQWFRQEKPAPTPSSTEEAD